MRRSILTTASLLMIVLGMFVVVASVAAQEDAEPMVTPPTASVPMDPVPKIEVVTSGLDGQLRELKLRDTDLALLVRLIADDAKVNVVLGEDVQGTVSCNLANVTVRYALKAILTSNGYDFYESGGVLVVVSAKDKEKLAQILPMQVMVRKAFHLPFTGKETEFVPTSGESSIRGGGDEAAQSIDETIRDMLSGVGKMAYYERQHLAIVEDSEAVIEMITEFVDAVWAVPRQVFIDSKLVEVSLEEGDTFGITWDASVEIGSSGKDLLHPKGTTFDTVGDRLVGPTDVFTFGVVNANIESAVEALLTRRRIDLKSNPRMLVTNHRTATIIVGQEIPYIDSIESTGGDPIRTTEFKEVATRLEVTPHIADDGKTIFMDVHPSSKNVIDYIEETNQPVLSTREAITSVAVQDGSTLFIGGMVQRNRIKNWAEVPFFAKIPLIGALFRQKHHQDTKNDLVFLLSPRIVTPELIRAEIADKQPILEPLPPHAGEGSPGHPKW